MRIYDEEGIPFGWEEVSLGDDLDAFCDAAERGDLEEAERIVETAYERLYARTGGSAVN